MVILEGTYLVRDVDQPPEIRAFFKTKFPCFSTRRVEFVLFPELQTSFKTEVYRWWKPVVVEFPSNVVSILGTHRDLETSQRPWK